MKTKQRRDASSFARVERADEAGPPTAFMIWNAGSNVTDHGPTIFSERSAKLLLEEQETRGNRYSFDVNHLSLDKDAPLDNQRAVGFFSLEVRDGNLWAIDCEWTDTVRSGLMKNPPEWKYFSPAYDIDQATAEVVSFLNCALTNNPATHHVTALASRVASKKVLAMKWSDIKSALEGKDEDAKAAAYATIAAAFPDEGDDDEKKKDADEAPESKKEPAKDSDDEPEKKDGADDPEKKDSDDEADKKASVTAALDAKVRGLESKLASFTAERDAAERKTLIAGRVMSAELAKLLSRKSVAEVREVCATLPKKSPKDLAAEASVQATRGQDQGERTARLSPEERAQMDARMGIKKKTPEVRRDGRSQIFETMTASDARRAIQASATKKEGAK